MMRQLLALLLVCAALISSLNAQAPTGDPVALYARKVGKPFLKLVPWEREYASAKARAKDEGRLIFGYFTRSYALCPSCDKLEDGVLIAPWWQECAKEVVPFINIMSYLDGHPDQGLMAKKGGERYPYTAFLDAEGTALWSFYLHSEEAFRAGKARAEKVLALRDEARAHPDDADLWVRWLVTKLARNPGEEDEASLRALLEEGKISAETRRQWTSFESARRFDVKKRAHEEGLAEVSQNKRRAVIAAYRQDVLALAKEGYCLFDREHALHIPYWTAVGFGAKDANDDALLTTAIEELSAQATTQGWVGNIVKQLAEK